MSLIDTAQLDANHAPGSVAGPSSPPERASHSLLSCCRQMNSSRALAFGISTLASLTILLHFHNRFWYAPDDGAYAHVAERILQGEVLHRDVQDIHMGYINFTNALALQTFGNRLVSMRYPLILLGVAASALAFLLMAAHKNSVAAVGALVVAALSIVQFLNPTAHWYCFSLLWVLIGCLTWIPQQARGRLLLIGFLVGLVFLFRQLTGVVAAIAVVTCLLHESPQNSDGGSPRLARMTGLIMGLGLAGYLLTKTDAMTFLMYGAWPLGIVAIVAIRSRVSGPRHAGDHRPADKWRLTRRRATPRLPLLPWNGFSLAR